MDKHPSRTLFLRLWSVSGDDDTLTNVLSNKNLGKNPCQCHDVHVVWQVSLRQMNQTRFYVVENRNRAVQVNLLIGGLPPLLTKEEYIQLIQEHLAIKSESVQQLCCLQFVKFMKFTTSWGFIIPRRLKELKESRRSRILRGLMDSRNSKDSWNSRDSGGSGH